MISGKKSYAEILDTLSAQQEPQQLQSFQQAAHSTILKEQRIQAANLSTNKLQTASYMHQNSQNFNEVPQSENVSNNHCEFDDLWSDLTTQVSNMRLSAPQEIQNCKTKSTKEAKRKHVNKNKKQGNKLLKTKENNNKATKISTAKPEGMLQQTTSAKAKDYLLSQKYYYEQQPSVENSSITSSSHSNQASRRSSIFNDAKNLREINIEVINSDHIQTKDQTKTKNKKHQFAFHNLPPIAHTVENLFLKSDINNPLLDEVEDDSSPDSNAPTMQDSLEPSSRSLSSKSASTEEQCENTAAALDANNDAVATNEVVDQNNNSVNDILTMLLGPNHQANPQNQDSPDQVKQQSQKVNATNQDILQRTYFEKAQYFVAPKGNQVPALF